MPEPAVLGRYHLVEPLGGGPTGEVFRAKVYGVAGFERQFAVKRFHAALASDPIASEIMATQARAYGSLSHPRIATLHEFGGTFMAVELVEGLDLARLLAGTVGAGEPMPLGARLTVLSQASRVIAYAHGRGVLHLGICPTNVLATPEGDTKVSDFGLLRARLRDRPAEDSTLAARLPYLAPEQLAAGQTSPMTDVFCLASLGYELVTGERAFGGKGPAEIAARVQAGSPRSPDAPDLVADVLRRALMARPEDRFPDAGAFADALDTAMRRTSLPGGRADVAASVRRALSRAADLQAQGMSGAVSFPLPAPPASLPGIPLSQVMAEGTAPVNRTLVGVPPPPAPPTEHEPDAPEIVLIEDEPPPAPAPVARPKRITIPPPIPRDVLPPRDHAPTDLTPTTAWKPTRPPREGWRVLVIAGVILSLGAGGFVLYNQLSRGRSSEARPAVASLPDAAASAAPVAAPAGAPDGAPATVAVAVPAPGLPDGPPAPVALPDARLPPGALPDAARAPVADAAVAPAAAPDARTVVKPPVTPPEPIPGGKLVITSTPAGAIVYIDGAAKGVTPLELPASGDRHKLTLLLPGHKLHKADVTGSGRIDARLEPAARLDGPAGIKVVCKSKDRFYIVVDGVDTGMTCPTDRIKVALGAHTVEVYDAVSDATSTYPVEVRETHNSLRVRLEQ